MLTVNTSQFVRLKSTEGSVLKSRRWRCWCVPRHSYMSWAEEVTSRGDRHLSELWIKYEVWPCWIICPLFCCRLFLYFVSLVDEHNIVCDNLRINLNNVTNCDESRLHRASSLHEVHFGSWYILRYSRWDRGDDSLHLSSTQIYGTFSKRSQGSHSKHVFRSEMCLNICLTMATAFHTTQTVCSLLHEGV